MLGASWRYLGRIWWPLGSSLELANKKLQNKTYFVERCDGSSSPYLLIKPMCVWYFQYGCEQPTSKSRTWLKCQNRSGGPPVHTKTLAWKSKVQKGQTVSGPTEGKTLVKPSSLDPPDVARIFGLFGSFGFVRGFFGYFVLLPLDLMFFWFFLCFFCFLQILLLFS